MPRGPQGEKRPADVIGNAVKGMRIATGEETEELDRQNQRHRNWDHAAVRHALANSLWSGVLQ
jgi:hypothetical protein